MAATLSYLVGCHRLSRRGVEEIAQAVFDVPISLGSVCHLEEQMSQALAAAHAEAIEAVPRAEVKHVDETSWRQAGKRCWLWLAATATVAAFAIHPRRRLAGLRKLLGETILGLVISDRFTVYKVLPGERRQLCWAYLIRDFRAMSERSGTSRQLGEDLLRLSSVLFEHWPKVRDGTASREWVADAAFAGSSGAGVSVRSRVRPSPGTPDA